MLHSPKRLDEEQINHLRLARSENVGNKTFKNLLSIYKTASIAIENLADLAAAGGLKRKIVIASEQSVLDEVEKVARYGAQLIVASDPDFPPSLKRLDDAPQVITVKGNLELLHHDSIICIVGARNASTNGCAFTKKLAHELGSSQIIIASGLARGIDTYAHHGSLDTGTIAVIAGGIDHIYPKENTSLYHAIAEEGIIVAELPIGTAPHAKHFPQRNRIISGLSSAVVVVEAAENSGSLITARFAKFQDKKIFAVPGSPLDGRCLGTNDLIRKGAEICTSSDDILRFLHNRQSSNLAENDNYFDAPFKISSQELSKYRKILHINLSFSKVALEDLAAHTGIPLPILNLLIVELELAGKVERTFGNNVCRIMQ
ncbi:MAG: DNA-processing protein DprA [Rickettsiales bacterium]